MQILHKLRITEKPAWDDFLRMIADAIHSPHPLHFPNGVMLTCSSLNFERIFETFIAGINDVDDVMVEWRSFVAEEREKQLIQIISEEKLKENETRKFMEDSFRNGEIKTTGTDIEKILPPVSRFSGGNRAQKKQKVIDKLKAFFERFFGIGDSSFANKGDAVTVYDIGAAPVQMAAEYPAEYGKRGD